MCGIIAVVRRLGTRAMPEALAILTAVRGAAAQLAGSPTVEQLEAGAARFGEANRLLMGVPGVQVLVAEGGLDASLRASLSEASTAIERIEADIEARPLAHAEHLEGLNAALSQVKDAVWAIERDRLRTAAAVAAFAGRDATVSALGGYLSIQQALSALDRLEVRGRDSAGLHVFVTDPAFSFDDPLHASQLRERAGDPLFRSRSVRWGVNAAGRPYLSFVYKAAAEIGELGDNTRAIRAAISGDELLRAALAGDTPSTLVVGHTRWASVGIISEANAHPLNSEQHEGVQDTYVIGALNGDVDNYADLIASEGLRIAPDITTDAKVIPALVAQKVDAGRSLSEGFRETVAGFEGSVAIAAASASDPDRVLLALRGSGQALYVGLAEDSYIVASEPYGVVEETARYIRMDGETPGNPDNPSASRGQIIELDALQAGTLEGIARRAYDGTALPVGERDVITAPITTRDIDRGDFPHFLLKEITESPLSFRKTLRGKLRDDDGVLSVVLGPETLPDEIVHRLASRKITNVIVTGQGTAAVAGNAVALAVEAELGLDSHMRVSSMPATELSGFALRPDMVDTLVVAISQSGTTTDTNRTVDLVRARGAAVVAIVNRRGSDLTDKADGVLYTSDGRDVEMSVASTKAFYAQVAAGFLLATAIADAVGTSSPDRQAVLRSLRDLPSALEGVLAKRDEIGEAARRFAPSRRYWAVVGNGANYIAAKEVRIKLSELCYKSIAHDATEDKKHIDLSSEPLILVCAAGLVGSTADDVAKEVAIYRAHKAAPIVIANEGETRFSAALDLITVTPVHPRLAFLLSAMAGHLFGYEAARAIDSLARPLREIRAAVEAASTGQQVGSSEQLLARLQPVFRHRSGQFFDGLRAGSYNGHLEANTAVRLSAILRYALGVSPLDSYQIEFGKIGTPSVVLDDVVQATTRAIDELTRPIDAIKHQAKTVTVGISRADETLLQSALVKAVLAAGAPRDGLSYRTLRTLDALDPAVDEVLGYTRYAVEAAEDEDAGSGRAWVIDRGGIAQGIVSRTDRDPRLIGTKHQVAVQKLVLVNRGFDGRTVVIVPEVKDSRTSGILLVHVRLHDRLPVSTIRGVLNGYRNRYAAIRDWVTETEPTFREDLLATISVCDLLVVPIADLARLWR